MGRHLVEDVHGFFRSGFRSLVAKGKVDVRAFKSLNKNLHHHHEGTFLHLFSFFLFVVFFPFCKSWVFFFSPFFLFMFFFLFFRLFFSFQKGKSCRLSFLLRAFFFFLFLRFVFGFEGIIISFGFFYVFCFFDFFQFLSVFFFVDFFS